LSLLSEVLVISGVAMDLVGAAVLSHAHNAESMVDIHEEIGAEKSALGEEDAVATQAQLLAEKRVGFFLLALGLSLYLGGPHSREHGGHLDHGGARGRRGGGWTRGHRALGQDTWA
jgi:hypothetical protein